jgi:hypothetical protein
MTDHPADVQFRALVVRELSDVISEHSVDRTTAHVQLIAEAIADRLTCPGCGFIDIGLGNRDNYCNDCTPRHTAEQARL